MSLISYISTGYYIDDCGDGIQDPITGSYVFTGFLSQYDSNNKAYCGAINNAVYLRSLSPCMGDPIVTTTTTTTTSTTTPPPVYLYSGGISYNWTGDFSPESNEFYDIVSWGRLNNYLSGYKFNTNQYFSQISLGDLSSKGVVLAIMNGSGLVTGFGDNSMNQLNIPNNLTGVIQVSVGFDHCLALKNNGTVTGWGKDNWGALGINSGLFNVIKAYAGIGGSVFLLSGGRITGTNTIGGGTPVIYPTGSGYTDINHYSNHILLRTSGGILTGIGANHFGESSPVYLTGVKRLNAGTSVSMSVYNGGLVTGYGTSQSSNYTPNISRSGIDIQLKSHIGTALLGNQSITQWSSPWVDVYNNTVSPSYLTNNIVAISQGDNSTAVIFKRLTSGIAPQITTGYNYLWRVSSLGGLNTFGGVSVGDLYPPGGILTINCNNYSYFLSDITSTGTTFTLYGVPNCNSYSNPCNMTFTSVRSRSPIININYSESIYPNKTGFAATGITTLDVWNSVSGLEPTGKTLYCSDGSISTISGGYVRIGTGVNGLWGHADNMYASFFSGQGNANFGVYFTKFPSTGFYKIFMYGHGPNSGQNSRFITIYNNIILSSKLTYTGINYDSTAFSEGYQYVSETFSIRNTNDNLALIITGFINGIQIVPPN